MAQIICTVERRYLRMEQAVDVTTGSIGSIQCSFTFDAEWDGLTKTAIFRDADGSTYPILITDDTCTVPNEAIADGCYLTMGVMGTRDGNVVVATEWKNGDLNTGCYTAIAPPSEDIYLQILNEFSSSTARVEAAADKVQASANEIQASLPAIHADAETAKAKANEATKAAGEAEKSRDKAKEYQDAAQASAADALSSAQGAAESEENVAAMQSNVQGLANQVAADKADVAAKAQTVAAQARQVKEVAESFPPAVEAAKKAITDEGTKQVGLVASEGTEQVKSVADKGAEQVAAVNTAGAAQISAATAQADRAQQEADRAEQEANRAAAIDAYTKEESRQVFAGAIVGEKTGASVRIEDVCENTLLRKAEVQGATTEVLANPDAEKSPDNIASISGVEPTKVTVCGKNLLPYKFESDTQTSFGITATRNPDGSITMQGINDGTGASSIYLARSNLGLRLPAGTYTLSAGTLPSGVSFYITPGYKSGTFTLQEETDFTIAYFNVAPNTDLSSGITVYPQLEVGSTATSYEPYTGSDYPLPALEPLMSLSNGIRDEYDAVTGVETRRIGKRILDGTETYRITAQTNTDRISVSQTDKKLTNGLCSHFATGLIGDEKPGTIDMRASDMTTFFVVEKNAYTVESWKAYLSAQLAAGTPVTIYYELKEPIITQHDPATIPVVYPDTNVYADDGNISVSYNRDSNQVYGGLSDALSDKVDKVTGKGLSTNDYTTAEKDKLAGIAQNANNYTHPITSGNKHIPSGGADKQILRWSADGTAVWDEEIDAYTKAEIDSKFDAINTIMVPMLIKCYGIKEAMHQFVSAYAGGAEDLSPIVGRFFEAAASTIGETYTTQFYKYSANTSTEGVKLDDNAGLTCIPSTIATAGTDDYANLPLFACFDCNYTIDADTLEPVIHAIKDVYGEFTSTPTDSFVGVLQMTGWVRRTSGETTKTVEYKAQRADGFEPLPEAVRVLDNTVRPFVIHAKYAAGYNSAGLLSSVSGVQPATLRTGSAGSTSISHNGQIAKWREWGTQYCGSSLCDIAFVQLMLEIKYAVLGSAQVMQGCRSYSTDTYQAAVSESGVTRVLLTAANAAYFVAGSCVSLGTGNNRAEADCYDICDISKITSVEDVTVDDVAYKAINLDTETTFNTTTDTYIIPQPWRTGSTDDVPGNDGSPYSNTSGKEPFKIQGIELMLGFYEVPADTTLYEDAEKYTVYLNRKASEIALGGSGTNPVTVGTIPKEETASWGCVAELNWDANNQEAYMLAQEMGGSTTTGYRARVYRDAAATTGWREWPAFGYLKVGGSGGFACAGLYAGLGTVGWDIGARACGSGGNRGDFTSAYEEDMLI